MTTLYNAPILYNQPINYNGTGFPIDGLYLGNGDYDKQNARKATKQARTAPKRGEQGYTATQEYQLQQQLIAEQYAMQAYEQALQQQQLLQQRQRNNQAMALLLCTIH